MTVRAGARARSQGMCLVAGTGGNARCERCNMIIPTFTDDKAQRSILALVESQTGSLARPVILNYGKDMSVTFIVCLFTKYELIKI